MPRKTVRKIPPEHLRRDTTWSDHGLCASDPDMFGDDRVGEAALLNDRKARGKALEQQQAEAKAVCWRCPVREACHQDALARRERHGIRGGFDPEQRKEQLKRLDEAAKREAQAA